MKRTIYEECERISEYMRKLLYIADSMSIVGLKDSAEVIFMCVQGIEQAEMEIRILYGEVINDRVKDAEAMRRATLAAILKKD